MHKIRLSFLDTMMASQLTNCDVCLLLHCIRYQDEQGLVRGVHFTDLKYTMSHQKFYDALEHLQNVHLISIKKENRLDIDIQIIGNDCSNMKEVLKEGYLNINKEMFESKEFYALKGNEKLMAMKFLVQNLAGEHSVVMKKKNLLEKYSSLFRVQERSIKSYLHNLKAFFAIGIKDCKYYITAKKVAEKSNKTLTEPLQTAMQTLKSACRRIKITINNDKDLQDAAYLQIQYKKKIQELKECGFFPLVENNPVSCFIQRYKDESAEQELKPALLHKCLRSFMNECTDKLRNSFTMV